MRIFAHEFDVTPAGAEVASYEATFRANVSGETGPFRAEHVEVTNTSAETLYFSPNGGREHGIPVHPGQTRAAQWCHAHETAAAHGAIEWSHVHVWGKPGVRIVGSVVACGRSHLG